MSIEILQTVVRSHRITFRLSAKEFNSIQEFCEIHNVTASDFLRQCVKQADHKLIEEDRKERE